MDTTTPTRLKRSGNKILAGRYAMDEAEAIRLNGFQPVVRNTDDAGDVGEFSEWLRKRRAQREDFVSPDRHQAR